MFLTLDIKGINDIRLISRPIHVPNHELEDTDTNTPPTKVISSNHVSNTPPPSKGKGKVHPRTGHGSPEGGVQV